MNKLVGRAVLPLLGLSLLAGCSPTGGTAAIVNGVAIPDSRVTSFAQGCSAALQDQSNPQAELEPNALRPTMLQLAVLDEMSRQQASGDAQAPTDDQLLEEVRRRNGEQFLVDERCAEATTALMRHEHYLLTLRDEYLGSYTVEMNPRYGVWDPDQLIAVGSSSLSTVDQYQG